LCSTQVQYGCSYASIIVSAEFAIEMLSHIDENSSYMDTVCISDEATFHLCGKVNKHNCCIGGYENPHVVLEHERDTPKMNVWCGLMKDDVIDTFFLHKATVTKNVYLDMVENFALYLIPTDHFNIMMPPTVPR
jgi:hypothetical protein